ncbi:MAG: hypothetical protein LKF36_03880 [Lactobacillus sp.]|jgi:hypothetical protein|nr:hypothetical protein [Lactobacillus sp.]
MTVVSAYMYVNTKKGKRFVLACPENNLQVTAKEKVFASIWNPFLGWLVVLPTFFKMHIGTSDVTVQSKFQFLGSQYDIFVDNELVGSLATQASNYHEPYKIVIKGTSFRLIPHPGNTYFELRDKAMKKVFALRRNIADPDKYAFAVNETLDFRTATGLAMAILDSYRM